MADGRSQSIGRDYALPEGRYLQSPQEAPSPGVGASPFFNLPEQNQDLAYVEGVTDKYYDTRGKIEAFALDMSKRYGVDVTQPDYTQPGGGIPFKTYNKLATELLVTANDLKQSMSEQKAQEPYYASGAIRSVEGFDQNAQPINRMNSDEQYFSTKLLPEVEQANTILKTDVHTEADQRRFKEQVTDPLVARLTSEMNREGISASEKERIRYNINALVQQPRTQASSSFFRDWETGGGKKVTFEEDILRDTTNLAQGKWAKDTYKTSTDQNGDPILINSKRNGEQYGEHQYEDEKGNTKRLPRIIERWVKKPDGVYLEFKQQAGTTIPPEKVSDQRGDAVASVIISSNPKYGDVRKMYETAREKGFTDDSGSVINESLLAQDESFNTPDPSTFGEGITVEKKRIINDLKAKRKDPGVWSRKSISFKLPDGTEVKFFPNRIGEGWYLEGGEGENLPEEEVVKFLGRAGYFDKFIGDSKSISDQNETPENLTVNKGGKKPY